MGPGGALAIAQFRQSQCHSLAYVPRTLPSPCAFGTGYISLGNSNSDAFNMGTQRGQAGFGSITKLPELAQSTLLFRLMHCTTVGT